MSPTEYNTLAEMLISKDENDIKLAMGIIVNNRNDIPWEWLFTFFYITPSAYDDGIRVIIGEYSYKERISIMYGSDGIPRLKEIDIDDVHVIYNSMKRQINNIEINR